MDPSPYVVTEALGLRDVVEKTGVALVFSLVVVLFVIYFGIGWGENGFFGVEVGVVGISLDPFVVIVVGGMVYGLFQRARPETLLAVRSEGATVGSVSVPWSSIEQVVVIQPEPSTYDPDEPEVGLRLTSGALLPAGLTSLVIDPSTPADIPTGLRTTLDGQPLDIEHLVEAVHANAPPRVSVVKLYGTVERTLGPGLQ